MVATATMIRTSPRRYIDRRGAPAFRPRSSLTLRDRGRLSRAVDVIDARNMPDRLKAASRKPRGGRGDLQLASTEAVKSRRAIVAKMSKSKTMDVPDPDSPSP